MLLDQILHDKLIPWSNNAADRMIVPRPRLRTATLPEGVRLEKRALIGERKVIKKERIYRNTRILIASWPECGLNESRIPKLACVVTGSVDFQLGSQAVLCGPGHFIVIPPEMPHPDGSRNISDTSKSIFKSTFCEVLYFRLYPHALQIWLSRYEPNLPMRHQLENYLFNADHTIQLYRVFMEEALSTDPTAWNLSEQLFQCFLQLLARDVQEGRFQEVPQNEMDKPHQRHFHDSGNFAEDLHQYIQSHLFDRPTLNDTAREMYLSRAQFSRRVRAETGKTFVELLNEHRIETAKELLRDSDWTVSSIATFIGYRTPHYFQSLFRERTGMTPKTYRDQSKKD